MSKKISFKMFFAVLWRGIRQVLEFILKPFGYKGEDNFSKVIWRIFACCVTAFVAYVALGLICYFAEEVVYDEWIRPHTRKATVCKTEHISNYIVFQDLYGAPGRIFDKSEQKILMTDVDWVVVSEDKDSLAVFSQNGKRGYVNRFTGEVAIPLSFSRAWVFSDGLAAVEKDGELMFIDHSGRIVIDKDFQVHYNDPAYSFKNGHCVVQDAVTGKDGLIDREGNWVIPAEYDNIYNSYGFWHIEKDGYSGLYDSNGKEMFPATNTAVWLYDDIIEVRFRDNTAKRYDHEGKVVVDFVIDSIENLLYETTGLGRDDEGNTYEIYEVADKQRYCVIAGYGFSDHYGLIDRNGKRITEPLYTQIEAIGKDLYLCQPDGIIINGQGKQVKQ